MALGGDMLVEDVYKQCSLRGDEQARALFRLPLGRMTPDRTDVYLEAGDRRHGQLWYQLRCPSCRACQAVRIPVNEFSPSRTHRRTLRRGDALLTRSTGPVVCDSQRTELYNKHLDGRGLRMLGEEDEPRANTRTYESHMWCMPGTAVEYRLHHGDRLVAVAVTDIAETALSAHYTLWDPDYAWLSLGTYSLLNQLREARQAGKKYLYLGTYLEGFRPYEYKVQLFPHERRINGQWVRFDK